MFKKALFYFFILSVLNSCATQQKAFSASEWYAFTKTSTERLPAEKTYAFSNETVKMYGENIGCLFTKKSYKNFELSLEFRWNMEDKSNQEKRTKNSGVMYNIPVDSPDKIWPKGIQFQIKEKTTGDFIFLDQLTAVVNGKQVEPGASVTSPKFSENEKPYGEWNQIVIKSYNGKIMHYLNGKLVNECTNATSIEGKISLNYEGSAIDFKNIHLKQINTL